MGVVGGANKPFSGVFEALNGMIDLKNPGFLKLQKHHITCWRSQRKPFSWSFLCGVMLFALGLISLFTGHVVSDLEYYSQRLIKRSLVMKWVTFLSLSLFLSLRVSLYLCIICLFLVLVFWAVVLLAIQPNSGSGLKERTGSLAIAMLELPFFSPCIFVS